MEEPRPGIVHKCILDHARHRFAIARDALHCPGLLTPSLGRVKNDQFPHARHTVMSGDHRHEFRGMARDWPGIPYSVGPIGIAFVDLRLPRPVRVHGHQDAAEVVRRVRVLPARIHDPSAGQHHRIPVVVLVETKPPDVRAVGVHQVQVGNVV